MLKVLPVQTKEEQKDLCRACGIKYDPDLLAYRATVNDEFCGMSQFKLSDTGGLIFDIAASHELYDREALFVLGRATLNFIDLCGVHNAFFVGTLNEKVDERLIRQIGFSKSENGKYEIDLKNFFDHPCQHK